jgi:hypothetical protein
MTRTLTTLASVVALLAASAQPAAAGETAAYAPPIGSDRGSLTAPLGSTKGSVVAAIVYNGHAGLGGN